jgi:hypothetical protein
MSLWSSPGEKSNLKKKKKLNIPKSIFSFIVNNCLNLFLPDDGPNLTSKYSAKIFFFIKKAFYLFQVDNSHIYLSKNDNYR